MGRGFLGADAALAVAMSLLASPLVAGPADTGPINSVITGDITGTHDPVIAREGNTYYVFGTGSGGSESGKSITLRTSTDLINWKGHEPLFTMPAWVKDIVPGARGMWAPDITFFNSRYYLYYAVSSFGSNRSAIGLFTSPTLDPNSPNYKWTDEGLVVASTTESDFNAIDANHFIDRDGKHWLTLGSFWTGLKMFRLNDKTGKLLDPNKKPLSIASRPAPEGGPSPIEAPFLISHGSYYYLFASYDYCCKGPQSNYYMVVGRSKDVRGPYVGKAGTKMMNGQGTVVMRGDQARDAKFRGPGHNGFLHDTDGKDYLVYHAYDITNKGTPTLRITPITWDERGWPALVR